MKNKIFSKVALAMLLAPNLLGAAPAFATETEAPAEAPVETPAPTVPEVPETPAPTPEVPETPAPTPEVPETPTPIPSPAPPTDVGQIPPVGGDVDAPVLSVAPIKMVKKGAAFNPLEGVYANDNVDGNITSKVTVTSNNVNVNVATPSGGTPYQVTYSVTNSASKTTTTTIDVYVIDSNYNMLEVSIPDITIAQNGDYAAEIKSRMTVKNPDGSTADRSSSITYPHLLFQTISLGFSATTFIHLHYGTIYL